MVAHSQPETKQCEFKLQFTIKLGWTYFEWKKLTFAICNKSFWLCYNNFVANRDLLFLKPELSAGPFSNSENLNL